MVNAKKITESQQKVFDFKKIKANPNLFKNGYLVSAYRTPF